MFSDFFNNIFGGGFSSGTRGKRTTPRKGQSYVAEMDISLEEAYHGCSRIITIEGKKLRITTKPGTKDKQKIKLKGKGSPGLNGGQPGDLIITIHVRPNPNFVVKGNNIYVNLSVDLYTAVLGGKIQVPTLNGNVNMTLPKGTQGGKTLRLKGKGMPIYGSKTEFGDLYVVADIEIPINLSTEEEDLFKKLKTIKSCPQ